ncbi:MAG TPA: Asp-tRNA(Asn)/Glu-tRNA(Gln) amidotransferase subunit GatB [Candidatus Saccharimonadaceae bacterium]|nr:Asp-tRNA(Asn)/Glu-tRNA(Gln) amidotransferase subunit GatB [Candidatus Saccharimonadaceae bacterium]
MANQEMLDKYDMTIGIECHVQLATKTKLFSGADNDARDQAPNAVTSPIDFGLPGMLPVLNHQAVVLAVRAGKALNAEIAPVSRFDRKHYFYPDLPKGYQISQMYQPIILSGHVDAPLLEGGSVKVRIHHAHLEEDAGKLTHYDTYSLVDLNRAGTPLIEIVSEPDMHSPAEAKAFATELHRLMTYAGVTNGDLYHGNMRFDVNISVAKKGASELGTRAEVKNLNSFRSVERAAEYEFHRQVERLEKGERIIQETRGWDDATGKTSSQRSKEDAQDYRYMPDPDIPPIVLKAEQIREIQATMTPLPDHYRQAWKPLQFEASVTNTLLDSQESARLVQSLVEHDQISAARRLGLWFAMATGEELYVDGAVAHNDKPIPTEYFIELSEMVEKNELNSNAAKTIFFEMLRSSRAPREIADSKNLLQVSDESAVMVVVDEVLADPASAQSIADIKAGQEKAIGFLVGQVMKRSAGKANPALAQKLIRQRLDQ